MQWFQDFQMPQSGVIQRQIIVALVKGNAREVFYVAPQILCQIMQRAARRADGGGFVLEAKAVERGHLEMFAHSEKRRLGRERPVVITTGDPSLARGRGREPAANAFLISRVLTNPATEQLAHGNL